MTVVPGDPADPPTLDEPLAEAMRVIDAADAAGLTVRLMGGMAVRAHAPDWTHRTRRTEVDLDFATTSRDRVGFYELLAKQGYTPDKRHNALFGQKQAYFMDVPHQRPVDVLVDELVMCHRLEFGGRLKASRPTLPLAELLLTKLQIVKINRKDVLDALILLAEHPLGPDDGAPDAMSGQNAINVPRITSITSSDWGWWRTVTGNLDTLEAYISTEMRHEDLDVGQGRAVLFQPGAQVVALRKAIEDAPKTTRWKMRARVGDRVKWYDEPEEMGHGSL